jgi:hypothetical protein
MLFARNSQSLMMFAESVFLPKNAIPHYYCSQTKSQPSEPTMLGCCFF